MRKVNAESHHPIIYVLWGAHFDELAAVSAVTGLRALGIRVRVIGLSGPSAKGAHGLGLQAEWTLDQALAALDQAIGVVIPCTTLCFQRFWADPRVQMLCRHKPQGRVWFVVWMNRE